MNARVKFVSATIMHLMIFFFFLPIVITAAYIGLESVVPTTKLLPYPTNLVLSAMAFAVGWYWMIWSNFYLFKFGRGTSLEIAGKGVNQTQLLQTDGPYAYCRNPMAFGFVMAYVVGLGFFLHSLWAIALAIASDVGLRIYLGASRNANFLSRKATPMSEDVRIRVSVARVNGACRLHYKQGDEFLLQGTTTPSYFFCGAAYYILYPALLALANGASFSFRENPNTATTRCPDDGKIEFLIERLGRCGGAR